MSYFDADMIAEMRAQVAQMLPSECTLKQVTQTVDANGYTTSNTVTVGTIACRVDPINTRDEVGYNLGRETMSVLYLLTVAYDAALAVEQIVTYDGDDYEIVQINDQHSANVSKRAVIRRTV